MKPKREIRLKDIIKYFIEALIVVLGVVLGLALTQQNSQKKTDRNTKTALYQVIEEIETNILKFDESLEYHEKIGIQIDSVLHTIESEYHEKKYFDYKDFRFNELDGWNGLGTVDYEDIIFESARINGVFQELNIETIKLISEAYSQMRTYDDFKKTYWDKFFSLDSKTTVRDIMELLFIMKNDITNLENQTLEVLKRTKTELEIKTHNNVYSK